MSLPRLMIRHIGAMRAAVRAMQEGESFTSFLLSAQRVRTSVEHLGLLSVRTPQVEMAAAAIRDATPRRADEAWSPETLLLAIDDFEAALEASGPNRMAQSIGAWTHLSQSV